VKKIGSAQWFASAFCFFCFFWFSASYSSALLMADSDRGWEVRPDIGRVRTLGYFGRHEGRLTPKKETKIKRQSKGTAALQKKGRRPGKGANWAAQKGREIWT